MSLVTDFTKEQILIRYSELQRTGVRYGLYSKTAKSLLKTSNILVNRFIVRRVVRHFRSTGSIERKKGGGRPSVRTPLLKQLIDEAMRQNDETTAVELQKLLQQYHIEVSLSTISKTRAALGWTLKGTRYCHMLRESNIPKRIDWVNRNINDSFENVIWSDETSVWMEQHKLRCFRKKTAPAKRKPKPKHPLKVHVWAGISKRGATKVCIFDGIMDAELYTTILDRTLLPFLRNTYPEGHRFMQDNDPKHTSRRCQQFMEENGINWWKTPAESPDLNPIENVWHEMKECLRSSVKPRTKQELVDGILQFWGRMTVYKCNRYINHLKKVMPRVLECRGHATGF